MTKSFIAALAIAAILPNTSGATILLKTAQQAPQADFITISTYDTMLTREDVQAKREAEKAEEAAEQAKKMRFTEKDAIAVAKMLWGEARGCSLEDKQNCVRTVCNRVDDARYPNSPYAVVSQKSQYYGYCSSNPVDSELYAIAVEIMTAWSLRQQGVECEWNSYNSFSGDGLRNYFYTI